MEGIIMDYLELLNHSYEMNKVYRSDLGRLEFIADNIFDFATYENIVSSLMAKKCLEVCKAIGDRTTFDYISNAEDNKWYLVMVNMPFLQGKISWGSSIRGAFWDLLGDKEFVLESCGLYQGEDQLLKITFNKDQWGEFIDAMIKFTDD
jgi:hypothetical protein